jgi:membrane protein YdbS with pleckstrin-like domain
MDTLIIKKINLKAGEEIVSVVRHYVLTLWLEILAAFLLLTLPFFFLFPLFKRGYWGVGIFLALILLGIIYAVRTIAVWYYNSFVITNKKIIDIDQRGFFERIVSEASYDKVQDVSWRRKGIWQTIFRYGNVRIQIANSSMGLEIRNIRNPEKVHQLIIDLSHPKPKDSSSGSDNFDIDTQAPNSEEFKIIKESIGDLDEKQLEELEGTVRGKIRQIKLKKLEEIKNLPPEE